VVPRTCFFAARATARGNRNGYHWTLWRGRNSPEMRSSVPLVMQGVFLRIWREWRCWVDNRTAVGAIPVTGRGGLYVRFLLGKTSSAYKKFSCDFNRP
jgi:hypothetical protein